MSRNIASRKAPAYDSRVHGGRESSGPPGNYVLNNTVAAVNLQMPRYNDGPLIFRPFPMLDYNDPTTKLQPGRTAPEQGAYSHWIVGVRAASYVGINDEDKVTFLLHMPGDKEARATNPYVIFFKAVNQAYKTGEFGGTNKVWDARWNQLMLGKKKKGAAITEDKKLYFIQAAVYANGDKDYIRDKEGREKPLGLGEKDMLPVLQLPPSALNICSLFDTELAEYDGDADVNFSAPFMFGDPVGKHLPNKGVVKGGKIIKLFNPVKTKIDPADNNTFSGTIKDIQGYEVEVLDEYVVGKQTFIPRLDEEDTKRVFERVQFWFADPDDPKKKPGLLNFAAVEQQCYWMAKAMKAVPQLLSWAWGEHPEFMTDEVKGVLASRVSAVMPGKDEDDDDDVPVTTKKKKTDPTAKHPAEDDEDDEDDVPAKKKKADPDDEDDDDAPAPKKKAKADDEDDDEPAPKKKKPAADDDEDEVPAKKKKVVEEDDEPAPKKKKVVVEDDEDDEPAPKKKAKPADEDEDDEPAPKKKAKPADDDDDAPAPKKKPKVEDEDDDEPAPKKKPKPAADEDDDEPAPKKKKVVVEDEDDEPTPKKAKPADDEDEDDAPPKKKKVVVEDEDDDAPAPKKKPKVEEDEDDDAPAPKKKAKPADEDEDDEPAPKKKKVAADDEDDDNEAATKKSLAAAKDAKARSEKRATPDKAPPTSKGGSAKKK